MADDTKKEEKKKDAAKGDAPAGGSGKSGLIGIIAAVVILAGAGAGVGWYIVKTLTPAKVEKPAEPGAEGGGAEGHGEAPAGDSHGGDTGLLATGLEIENINLKANITGSGGTRYVTLSVGIWVPKSDQPRVNDPPVRRLIQAKLEETLRTYQLEDLQSPNIQARMKKDFGAAVERKLREIMPGRAPEQKFVLEITVTDLLTQ
jgi:flagellar basal body-associated protein FliL